MRTTFTSTRFRALRRRVGLGVELAPAREALGQQALDLLRPGAIGLDPLDVLPVIVGRAHPLGERMLLALQRLEFVGQRIELALLAEREPNARVGRTLAWRGLRLLRGPAIDVVDWPRALREPVRIATGILDPATAAFGDERLRRDVVEKRAIVADEKQRALVTLQRRFEKLERFDVEIV